jgi:hypothetical protein
MTVGAREVHHGSLILVIREEIREDVVHASLSSRFGVINADLSVGVDVTSVVPLMSNRLLASMDPLWAATGRIHVTWALATGGTLEDRPRYNKTSCFDPFPFPAATEAQTMPTPQRPKRNRAAAGGAAKKSAGRAAQPAKAAKQAWPKDLAEQTRAVRTALAAAGGIVTTADVARRFKNAKAPRVEEILATLVALGHARRTDSGYASA